MKTRKTFGGKLRLSFILFALVIFAALWLLQTVFLQAFYHHAITRNVQKAALEIVSQQESDRLHELMESLASENSLLVYLTDWNGGILFSTDEHAAAYRRNPRVSSDDDNPYHKRGELWNWQIGAYRNLPQNYSAFLEKLSQSAERLCGEKAVGYATEDGTAYVYGAELSAVRSVLYLSVPLDAVSGTVSILRAQLLWVTLASLALGFLMAKRLSKQFSVPVAAITAQAEHMAEENFNAQYKKGFCAELDALSDTLERTASSLRKLETSRRELMSNVSHDLRTPLTMIKGYAEMVMEISWSDEAQRNEDLSVIIRETDRLTELVNDILEYSSVRSRPMNPEPFDLSAAARYVAEQFAPLCVQKGYAMETQIEPNLRTNGVETEIKRVFYNLIDNALRHSGEEKRIRLTLKNAGTFSRAEVRDYGQGISKENLSHVWERYFTARQRRNEGGGLGLAITKEILERHHARFGAESEEGKGTLFWFELERL